MDSELGPEQEEPILEALDSYNWHLDLDAGQAKTERDGSEYCFKG